MNRKEKEKTRDPNPVSKASILSKLTFWLVLNLCDSKIANAWFKSFSFIHSFRWMRPIFTIGLKRTIEDDDIYAVTNSLHSDNNTKVFDDLWCLELKKKHPSFLRVILKAFGLGVFTRALLFSFGETLVKLVQTTVLWWVISCN